MQPFFISGIGTGIGKTLVAAILTESLDADYWKPVQAGNEIDKDSNWIAAHISNGKSVIHPESYSFQFAASPHIAARKENKKIDCRIILDDFSRINTDKPLIIEGAGGLMVPLNDIEFVVDLVKQMDAKLILVSRNYLGSINHSLLTAKLCRSYGIDVAGWIFNDNYLDYESEIVSWSGFPSIISIPFLNSLSKDSVCSQAGQFRTTLRLKLLGDPPFHGE